MPRLLLAVYFLVLLLPNWLKAEDLNTEFAKRLAAIQFDHYAQAPGYSEGPTWRNGEVFFCSGALLRVDAEKKVSKYLEINPAGTVLLANGHLLVADNKSKAILDISADGQVHVVVDQVNGQPLRGLNDLTVDARGNVYWTDPEGSTPTNRVGNIYRVRPNLKADRIGGGLAFPNGLEVDPASKFLYMIESQTKKILRYPLPADDAPLGQPELFYDLGGSGGDGCTFDAEGNLWVADFHRPETGKGRITVLSPQGKPLAYLNVPAKVVSNIAFGGPKHDEIFCTTGDPPGVFHAKVGVKGFAGHSGKFTSFQRPLNVVPIKPHRDAVTLKERINAAFSGVPLFATPIADAKIAEAFEKLTPQLEAAIPKHRADLELLAEIKRLGGKAVTEVDAPKWLREITGDDALAGFSHLVEIELNERTDGHKEPTPKKLSDRVTDDWLKRISNQTHLRNLQLSGTAITSAGLIHLKKLTQLERLNICLTAVSDDGFEHLAGLTNMKRLTICASKITGSGFKHLQGMTKLESINLHSAPASDEGLESIGKLKSLRRLEIVHTHVTDAGLKHLAGLTNLRQLHIHGPTTTEAGLPFLSQLRELEELDVYDKPASNATLKQISQLPNLTKLMLVQGVFDDEGIKSLETVKTLEEVSLNSPKITDAAIETLGKLTRLKRVQIQSKGFTKAGKEKLQQLLPNAEIVISGS